MNTGLSSHVFPRLRVRDINGAGDEEVFETKASPPAVAGPLTARMRPSVLHSTEARLTSWQGLQFLGSRP
jgi:hypothetical protein